MSLTRRAVMSTSACVAFTALFGPGRLFANSDDAARAIKEFTAGTEINQGKVVLTTPKIAENGNIVPVSVTVESPMTEHDFVDTVVLIAEGNPNPQGAIFYFSQMSGEAKVSTRIRLAQTQNVVALAKMNNGEIYKASNYVKVTIGGCGA